MARSIFRQVTLGGDTPTLAAQRANRPLTLRDGVPQGEANRPDPNARFDILLGVLRPLSTRPSVLDLGCGPGLLLDYLRASGRERSVDYTGVDLSPVFVETATRLWPEARFLQRDIFEAPFSDQSFDYVIVNGLPTDSEMIDNDARATQTKRLIEVAFRFCRVGVAVDVSQSHGAHQHDAFFAFLADRVTRHVALLGDCGLPYDTAYLYREPNR